MARLIVRESARETLNGIIHDQRQRIGFVAARALRERIMRGIYRLRDYPELGRRLPEFEANIRQLIIVPYRILYEFADDTVTILDIVHGRSLFPDDDKHDSES